MSNAIPTFILIFVKYLMNFIRRKQIFSAFYFVCSVLLLYGIWKQFFFMEYKRQEYINAELLNCDDFEFLSVSSLLGEGWNKRVYNGSWRNFGVAVKTINSNGHAIQLCQRPIQECLSLLRQSLSREKNILQVMQHPNIIKLYGFCIPPFLHSKFGGNGTLIVELGAPVTSFSLLQTNFRSRLDLAQDLSSLLLFLGAFPAGAVVVPDLRLQQFVVVDERLKLCDVDDLHFGDRICSKNQDCISYLGSQDVAVGVSCKNGKCDGLNDALNTWRACRSVLPYLLFHRTTKEGSNQDHGPAPVTRGALQEAIHETLKCKDGNWSSSDLDEAIRKVVRIVYAM